MDEFVRVKHSFNAGDLVVLMAGLRQVWKSTGRKIKLYQRIGLPAYYYEGAEHPVQLHGNPVCMNSQMLNALWPLVDSQEYIECFLEWKGQAVDFDIDLTRDSKMIPMPYGHIHTWAWALFPEMTTDLSEPWLAVEAQSIAKEKYRDKVVINRTSRYQNPYITHYFLKDYQDQLLFMGTEGEHQDFCTKWGLEIAHEKTDNFYKAAQVIQWTKGGIYNQSCLFHVADALKKHRLLEYCPQFPNTFATGAGGYGFYHQSQLEYYVHRLFNA